MLVVAAARWILGHWGEFSAALEQHLLMSGIAVAIALAVGLPLAVLVADRRWAAFLAINGVNALRTIPSLAILAAALPLLGIGLVPSVVALVVLALPPILINALAGLRGVDADVLDAARGMGMRRRQVLRRVRVPLAAPAMFAGARTAAVQVLAGATLASFIGGGGLGDFITAGIAIMDLPAAAGGGGADRVAGDRDGVRARVGGAAAVRGAGVIRLEGVSKRFGDGAAAVDELTLEVPEGSTTALIGPSGCGKTTTLRMINRLIEPSSGRLFVAGEDVTRVDPVLLRRRIGYVIQQVGLFPHMTVAENVASVPRLLGWAPARIRARTEELLALVGLDPAFGARYPRALSGGQRQRVGVARALAADPPVLLMDEPFGAIDPIARGRLQEEFLRILRTVRKTVVVATHDLDEAVRLGDRVAILRAGRLVQYDTPDAILGRPADAFVEAFAGPDRALRRLSLRRVAEAMEAGAGGGGVAVGVGTNLRDALSRMLAEGVACLDVVDGEGRVVGVVRREALLTLP